VSSTYSDLGRESRGTIAAVHLPPVLTPADLADWDPRQELSDPGEFPFTRGIQPTMYRGRLWTMRQYAGFATAQESNRRYRYLLAQGVSGLSVAFDLPTQMGYDSDHLLAAGEVGRVGVAIDSIEDMSTLLDGIPLGQVSTSMTINATAIVLLRCTWRSRSGRACRCRSCPARSRTTS
jgi:methylmalonyl-CoA mutase N-terminal domain/subunit